MDDWYGFDDFDKCVRVREVTTDFDLYEFRAHLGVNGKELDFTLDTGSQVTIITEQSSRDLKLDLVKPSKYLVGADGTQLNVIGESEVELSNKNKSVDCLASIMRGSRRNLLGIVEIHGLHLLHVVNSLACCFFVFDPFTEFAELFQGLGTMPDIFSIALKPDTKPYKIFSPRPIPIGLRDQAKQEINKMLELNVIRPVDVPTEWCFGLTIAFKADGKIRMCVDLTMLNRGVQRELYPLPRVSDMLSQLSTGQLFTKLDANSGFWQIILEEESQLLTTFLTPWGRFCYNRMPFGISSAPEFFQKSMEKILHGLEGVICMMDDILIFGKNSKEHWKRVRLALERIRDSGMTLKKEKCQFGMTEVKFLGHLVSVQGIKPDPDKVTAIMALTPPTCKREARSLMGMVNYLNKFSKKLAEISGPIYAVTGASDFVWGPDQDAAFLLIKHEISKAPVLCAFNVHCKHRVSADSSRQALGAVLLQLNADDEWQPVEFASRKLTDAETRYAMIELEALGITWACEKFDFYLVGRVFEVETDHKPLITLLGEKDLSLLPLRVQRFKMRLMRYQFQIFHTPGRCMYIADYLSRPSANGFLDSDFVECRSVERFVAACVNEILPDSTQEEEIIRAISKDSDCLDLITYIQSEWPEDISSLSSEMKRLFKVRDHLTTYGDVVLYNRRLFIPKSLRSKYLELCHDGHQGSVKCQRRARQVFWWPGCSSDIEEFVNKCNTCIKFRKYKHQPLSEPTLPSGPWVELGSDILDFKGQLYLLIVDYYTRWIDVRRLYSLSSSEVIKELSSIFSVFGVPKVLRSDNAGCYTSNIFKDFAVTWGFHQTFSSPRYPQSNGMAEKAVGTFKSLCYKSKDIHAALLAYRAAPMAEGFSPGELMFGRALRTPLGEPRSIYVDYEEFERIAVSLKERQFQKWNKKHNAKYLPELTKGQLVWVKAPTDVGQKGIVQMKDKHPQSYWVLVGDSLVRRNRKHLFVLQPDQDDSDSEDGILPLQLDSWEDNGNDGNAFDGSLLTPSVAPNANNSGDLHADLDNQASQEFLDVNVPNIVDLENNPSALHTNDQATPSPSIDDEFAENPNEGIEELNEGASSNNFELQDQETVSKYGRKRKPKRDKMYEYYE